jgi:hypothetical protein
MPLQTPADSPSVRRKVGYRKDAQKSRIGNGALLPNVDGRSGWVRRAKELLAAHVADLGGAPAVSTAEHSILRRAVVLTVELERLEQRFALAGEASAADIDLYARVAANLRRLLAAVGLQRRNREIGPTLGQLLRADVDQQHRTAQDNNHDCT